MSSFAQTMNSEKLDQLMDLLAEKDKAMGSLSLFHEGKEIYQKTIGYADLDAKRVADASTQYRIGSITKSFTATVIMQLVDEGKLNLDTPLSTYFPKLPNAKKITIHHLLGHRSGLYNFTNAEDYMSWEHIPQTKKSFVKLFIKNGTVFQPDEKSEYSNTNYVLLTFIAEEVEQKDFGTILKKRIFDPCQLKNTQYGWEEKASLKEALSYSKLSDWEFDSPTHYTVPAGAGAILSTATDINQFYNALFTGKLVSENALKQMQTIEDGLGLGLFSFPFYNKTAYGHTGGIDAYRSMAGYFGEDKLAIAYVGNGIDYPINDIMIAALSCFYDKDFELPNFKPALELTEEDLQPYLGTYSSPTFPLKVMITKEGTTLIGQATGQSSFPLTAFAPHQFQFQPAQLELEFKPKENTMILRQGGGEYTLTKE